MAAPLATRWIERALDAHEPPLTVAQYLALRSVADHAAGGGELARRTGVSAPAASQLIASVERAGWIERHADPADRRRTAIALSAAGVQVLASATTLVAKRLAPLLDGLAPPELDALVHLEEVLTGAAPPRRPPPRPHHGPRKRPPA